MTASPRPPQRLPLAGLRVIDLSRLLPGGYATQLLADFGADVVKIEDPQGGDPARWSEPVVEATSLYFVALNRNKRSLALDLKHPAGRDALLRVLATADVLVESFRPGVMDRLGLGPVLLRARFPRLIYCAITGYGQDGPANLRAGHDLNYEGYAGMLAMNLDTQGRPVLPPSQLADIAGGAWPALIGILTALFARGVTGQGDIVDVSMLDSTLALQPLLAVVALATGQAPAPAATQLHGGDPAYDIYQASDGLYITLGALEHKFWIRFCTLVERPDLIPLHGPAAWPQRAQVRAEVAAIFASRPRAAWLALLADEDACVGPVNTITEALHDPQIQARQMVRQANLGLQDFSAALAPTPRLVNAAPPPQQPPPRLGEHSDAILREAGLDEGEITTLHEKGVVPVYGEN